MVSFVGGLHPVKKRSAPTSAVVSENLRMVCIDVVILLLV